MKTEANKHQALISKALEEIKKLKEKVKKSESKWKEPIAIIGMSCRFPGDVSCPDEFWKLLTNGVDAISEIPADRWDSGKLFSKDPQAKGKMYTKSGGFLKDVKCFDYSFFGITPIEAQKIDPQQRLLLELSYEALISSFLKPEDILGSKTGVFVGISSNDYLQLQIKENEYEDIDPYMTTGWAHSVSSGRISFQYGFEGPSMAIDTACSSSLVALDLACQYLKLGSCDRALVGGVNLMLSPEVSINFSKAKMLSPDGKCKSFDQEANGYVRGEGSGFVVLQKLSDAIASGANILAVIKGSAVNQDGRSSGLTVPNGPAQERVIREALNAASLKPESVSFIEAHGTGTSLGDPIEANALGNVFGQNTGKKILVGSVKTNIGHLEAAAGIASVIKTVLCLQNKQMVPTLHFKELNAHIDPAKVPLKVVTENLKLENETQDLVAGVSSFGFSGTNAHIVIAEHKKEVKVKEVLQAKQFVLKLSSHSKESLLATVKSYKHCLENNEVNILDFSYSINYYRSDLKYKKYFVADSRSDLLACLDKLEVSDDDLHDKKNVKIAFLFTGQGSQYPQMGRDLYETERVFKEAFDNCSELFSKELGLDLIDLVYGRDATEVSLQSTLHTQPAIFALEYSLAQMWLQWGVKPTCIIGHSIGEIVGACIAKVFSLEDAVKLVAARAKNIADLKSEGGMLAIAVQEEECLALISEFNELSIAAINSKDGVVVSGSLAQINEFEGFCKQKQIKHKKLLVSQAFHSKLMSPAITGFRASIESIVFHDPEITLISCVTGAVVAEKEISRPDYWCKHILAPVRFCDAIEASRALNIGFYLEVGCKGILTQLTKKTVEGSSYLFGGSLLPNSIDLKELYNCVGKLFLLNVKIDFKGLYKSYSCEKLVVAGYPFDKLPIWFKSKKNDAIDLSSLASQKLNAYAAEIESYEKCHGLVDAYALQYLWKALYADLAKCSKKSELEQRLAISPKFKKLFVTILDLLQSGKFIEFADGSDDYRLIAPVILSVELEGVKVEIMETYEDSKHMFALLEHCIDHLQDVFSGRKSNSEVLFPSGDMKLVESVYKTNFVLKSYSKSLAEMLGGLLPALSKQKAGKIKILEVGSGTGGTSAFVFDVLDELVDKYAFQFDYTDLSKGFLQYGKKQYGDIRNYIDFKCLNIEGDSFAEDFELGTYDIVIASNVIHATSNISKSLQNIKKLLDSNGILILNETTKFMSFTSLTFGLADGWWLYNDEELRVLNSPMLSAESWVKVFDETGFSNCSAVSVALDDEAQSFQHLIFGELKERLPQDDFVRKASVQKLTHQTQVQSGNKDLSSRVLRILSEVSGVEEGLLAVDVNLFELGLDSLMLVQMQEVIEREFSVIIATSQFYAELDTISKINDFIMFHQPESAVEPLEVAPIQKLGDMVQAEGLHDFFEKQQVELKRFFENQIIALKNEMGQSGYTHGEVLRTSSDVKPNIRGFKFERDDLNESQLKYVNSHIDRYGIKTKASKQYASDVKKHTADWINSLGFRLSLKELAYPVVMENCDQARFTDIDGNEYLDFGMGYGVSFFGNNVPFIKEAIQNQINKGIELGPQSQLIKDVSALISELTGVDRVSFCNSGTEAVMVALRMARTVTKRKKIVLFQGSYHGTFDGILAFPGQNGNFAETQVIGTPDAMVHDVLILSYGDAKSLEVIKNLGDSLAAVLVEPVQSRNPSLQPKEFLRDLRQITSEQGTVLIFDEVLVGFRIHQGGAQAYFGVQADLVTYGKVVGGGLPIGVVAGKKFVMDCVDGGPWEFGNDSVPKTQTTVFQGTFCKHPLSMAAAFATLKELKKGGNALQEQVNQLTDYLAKEVNSFFEQESLPIKLSYFGSVFKFDTSGKLNPLLMPIDMELFYNLLIFKGFYTWEKRICFLSLAHTKADVDSFVQAIKESIFELRENGFFQVSASLPKIEKLETIFEASPVQKRLFSLRAFEEGKSPYQLTAAFILKGKLQVEQLQKSLQAVYRNHPVLSSKFSLSEKGDLFIAYNSSFTCKLFEIEAKGLKEKDLISSVELELDLVEGPALLVKCFKLSSDDHLLVFTTHHSVIDGLSWDVILQDFVHAMNDKPLTIETSDYSNYVAWQKDYINGNKFFEDERYWKNIFSIDIPMLELPTNYVRPNRKSGKGSILFDQLSVAKVKQIKEIAKANSCTVNMLLLSVYYVLMNKLSGQETIVVGMPVGGRPNNSYQNVVGMFANTIALPIAFESKESFSEFVARVKALSLSAYQHQFYPFEKLVDQFVKDRDLSRNPIFDTMFVFEKGQKRVVDIKGVSCEAFPIEKDVAPYDLVLEIIEQNEQMSFNFEYSSDLFTKDRVQQFSNYFLTILDQAYAKKDVKLAEINLWSDLSKSEFLSKVQGPLKNFGKDTTLVDLFSKTCEKNPSAVMGIHDQNYFTYEQIDRLSNGVAQKLLAHGLTSKRVMVFIQRSVNYLPVILGVMKAGAAFIPVEAKFGLDRVKTIAIDSEADYIFVDDVTSVVLGEMGKLINVSELLIESANKIDLSRTNSPAYIIYTSGSTGKPKGVLVCHHSICNSMQWRSDYYKMNDEDRVLQLASISFDSSLSEMLPLIISGGAIVFFNEVERLDIDRLANLIEKHKVTNLCMTPSFYEVFLAYLVSVDNLGKLDSIRFITLAGEETPPSLLNKHQNLLEKIKLYNEYGPTENSICATVYPFVDNHVTIGKPISNNELFIMNDDFNICPPWVNGQILLAGKGLTEGYLNRPDLTEKSFVFIKGKRFYLTGDMGCWDDNGNVLFKGRIDEQVKVRGYRIELGEVKSHLDKMTEIKDCTVSVYEDNGEKSIVAYLVSDADLDVEAIKVQLGLALPSYMIPSYFVSLGSLPKNNSGKIDKKALPAPNLAQTRTIEENNVACGPIENALIEVFKDVLNIAVVNLHDNYFHIGGDSIKAIQVVSRMNKKGFFFKVPDLFENPTIAKLSKIISLNATVKKVVYSERDMVGEYELSPIQSWFLEKDSGSYHHFNQSVLLEAKGIWNTNNLKLALHFVYKKHAALRSVFLKKQTGYKGFISADTIALQIKRAYITSEVELTHYLNRLQNSFDIESAPLFKASFIEFEDKEYLFLVAHHLVVDVVSWRIILDDLYYAYNSLAENRDFEKDLSLSIPFKTWSSLQIDFLHHDALLSELPYWLTVDSSIQRGNISSIENASVKTGKIIVEKEVSAETSDLFISKSLRPYNTEVTDMLCLVIYRACTQFFDIEALSLQLEHNGRSGLTVDTPDLNQTVGWFTTLHPVVFDLPKNIELPSQIKQIKERLRQVPNKGVGYGILKYLGQKLSGAEKPTIALNYLGQLDQGFDTDLFSLISENGSIDVDPARELDHKIELEVMYIGGHLKVIGKFQDVAGGADFANGFLEKIIDEIELLVGHCRGLQDVDLTPDDLTFKDISLEELDSLFEL